MSEVRNENIERKAVIFNVQKYNTFDGPGVRTLIFFQGCSDANGVPIQRGLNGNLS